MVGYKRPGMGEVWTASKTQSWVASYEIHLSHKNWGWSMSLFWTLSLKCPQSILKRFSLAIRNMNLQLDRESWASNKDLGIISMDMRGGQITEEETGWWRAGGEGGERTQRSRTEETGSDTEGSHSGKEEGKSALTEPGKTNRKVSVYFSTTEKKPRVWVTLNDKRCTKFRGWALRSGCWKWWLEGQVT